MIILSNILLHTDYYLDNQNEKLGSEEDADSSQQQTCFFPLAFNN